MNRIRALRPAILFPVALALAALAAYWPILQNDFIKFDDGFYVLHNPHVTGGLTLENIGWAFRTGYQGNWHPLTWLSHMLDVQLFGLNPSWHHLTNLLLHVGNALLLWTLLHRLTSAPGRSFFVAALFALHPLHVESVAWASERKDVLCAFFFFLMLLAYAAYAKTTGSHPPGPAGPHTPDRAGSLVPENDRMPPVPGFFSAIVQKPERAYLLSLGLYVLALMSKPMVVTAPLVMLLLDLWPLRRLSPRPPGSPLLSSELKGLLREKIPFFALAVISSLVTFAVQQSHRAMYLNLPWERRVPNAIASYGRYLGLAAWPKDLSVFYPLPAGSYPWPAALIFLAALALLAISLAAWVSRWRVPWFTTGWYWYLITLVPVIGLVQVGGQAFADRYTYIPLIGIFLCLVWALAEFVGESRAGRVAVASAGVAVLVACTVLTQIQTRYWRTDFTIFQHALQVTPNNALAHYHVGIAFRDQGQTAPAVDHFRAAIKADPSYAPAYSEIGAILENDGKDQEALSLYEQAFQATPWAEQIHNHLAAKLWAAGKQDEALAHYSAALRSNPDYPDAHFNLGLALSSRGQLTEAASHFATVCRLRPEDTEALGCLAEALFKDGRLGQAAGCYRTLTRLAPTNAEAHQNLGLILVEQGELGQAMAQFRQAVQLKPNWPDALNALAWVLATHPRPDLRNGAEAVELAERACQLSEGKQPRFWSTLDVAYAQAGRFTDAILAATKAKTLAAAAGQTNAAQAAESRIEAYRQQKPYRP